MDRLDPVRYRLGVVAQMGDVPGRPEVRGSRSDIPTVDDLMTEPGERVGETCEPSCGGAE
jgi:hypothetical protein